VITKSKSLQTNLMERAGIILELEAGLVYSKGAPPPRSTPIRLIIRTLFTLEIPYGDFPRNLHLLQPAKKVRSRRRPACATCVPHGFHTHAFPSSQRVCPWAQEKAATDQAQAENQLEDKIMNVDDKVEKLAASVTGLADKVEQILEILHNQATA
jgi:hypothetical protein